MTASESPSLEMSFELIRSRLNDPDFLRSHGISNEVPFYIFAYDAAREIEVRERTTALVEASHDGALDARIVPIDLWDVFCDICAYYDIFDDLEHLEEVRGTAQLLAHIQEVAMPEDYIRTIQDRYTRDFGAMQPGRDVLLITGIGRAYPFARAHDILENAQPVFDKIPVVMFYPGLYDQQSLRLFGAIADGNYYRAFTLL